VMYHRQSKIRLLGNRKKKQKSWIAQTIFRLTILPHF